MALKMTSEQRDELIASHGQPVPVVDEQDQQIYYLVAADYLHASQEQLRALIEEGIASRRIPADEAEDHLRRYAEQLAARRA
jgi:DNA-binding LacI/PurR family transcriptional regulator